MVAIALLASASWIAASANGATGNVTVTMDVASVVELTNNCTSTSATRFGTVQPGAEATTATGAGACSVSFGASNDTSALRVGMLDGAATAMSSPSVAWNHKRAGGLQFRAVDRASAAVIAMAGWYGLVVRSVDSGNSWTYEYMALPSGDYVFDIEHVPGSTQQFVAVGGNANIVSTGDFASSAPADPTWTSHRAALVASGWPGTENISGVAVVDALTWYLVGEQGQIARTVNGGSSFTSYDTPAFTQLQAIEALDANTIYASGSNGRIMYTTTGQSSFAAWPTATSSCGCWLNSIAIADASHVYVSSNSGIVTRWDGSSFATIAETGDRMFEPNAIAAVASHPDTVFVAGMYGKVYRSTDAGQSFTRFDTPVGGTLRGLDARSDQDVLAVGSSETVVHTANGGGSWALWMEDAVKRPLHDVERHPSQGQRAIAVGSRGDVRRTTDGGATWTGIASGTTANLNGLAWPSANRVVAVGSGGTILVSSNGGATWSPRSSGTSAELMAVTSAGDHRLWAVGTGGTILRSVNGGDTWTPQVSGTTQAFAAVEASTTSVVVASGPLGLLRRTADAGATWTTPGGVVPPAWEHPSGIAALDASTFYVTTPYSGLFRSADGGATFSQVASYGSVNIAADAVEAMGDTIAVMSRWGELAVSRDAGASWSVQYAFGGLDYNHVMDFALIDPHTLVAVDDLGTVVDQDEASLAASKVADYSAGANFASSDTTGAFGVCLQSLASATTAGTWVADGGTCTAVDSDPWKGVPATPQNVATAVSGATGTATFVWGVAPRADQPPGTYRAGIVFEAVAPAV